MANGKDLSFLRKFILFSEMSDEDLSTVASLLQTRIFKDGTNIFFEGEEGDRVYFLKKGRVKVKKTSPDGGEQILEIITPGDVFGEVVLFGIDRYPATTVAIGEVVVDYLSRSKFRRYFTNNPEIGWGMLKVMARKLARSQKRIENLGLRDTKGRVATLIMDMMRDFGEKNNQVVKLHFNRQELANFIGTSRETVSRTLSEFKSEGLIDIKGKKLIIKDIEGLKRWL
ncbi:Crp/Fnr family transcriptional regulator [Halothermothrix orenii]|uniref:Putative transcriptional regulator, Crp/Fnr family n=1 Tax=Halothermothrix orenii (strain H 168 / OCM 544 / DSM 9562) TaxID=373903 RepID=B8CWR3_HALOH|nr:Crp/Fnr family transcriptional regulator [Halothermothrix orenii]ACL69732.1 putative transcriptional regulator, Crp/Fnr family [Halothermothrix orenii H 168]